jgi:hypothetical protein
LINNAIPVLQQEVLRGNAWSRSIRLVTVKDRIPVILAPGTLVIMQVRAKRGRSFAVIKTFTTADGSILLGSNGFITITGFTGRETYLATDLAWIGELTIGPTENLLIPYLTIIFQLHKDAITIPAIVSAP